MKSRAQFLLLILVVGLSLWRESGERPLSAVDDRFASWLGANAPQSLTAAPVVLVEINDSTLQQSPWPWKPLDYTLFFQAIAPYAPSLTAIEPLLSWEKKGQTTTEKQEDAQYLPALHDFILKSAKVLLAARLGYMGDTEELPPMQALPSFRHVEGDVGQISMFNFIAQQPEESLRLAATASGFTNENFANGQSGSVPLLLSYCGQIVPSFALQAAMLALKVTPDDVRVKIGQEIDLGTAARIPIDARGRMRIDFHQIITRIGYDDLLLAASREQAKISGKALLEKLRGRSVLLARTDRDAKKIRLANGQLISTGEWNAAALATIETHEFIRKAPFFVNLLLLLLALVWDFFASRQSPAKAVMIGIFASTVYGMLAMGLLSELRILLPLVLPCGLALLVILHRLFFVEKSGSR